MYHNIISKILKPEEGELPEWALLFKSGWIEIEGEGKALVDEKAFKEIYANFKRRGNEIVFDYEHKTIDGDTAPAAGWIKDLRWTESGIEARTDWTEKAASHLIAKEYKYHSPVFMVRKSDSRVISVHSVALTNAPKTNHIKPILAKLNINSEVNMEKELKEINETLGIPEDSEIEMIKAKIKELKEPTIVPQGVPVSFLKALDLKDDADEKAVIASINALKKPANEVIPKGIITALGVDADADESTVVASIHALKYEKKGMVSREEFEQLQKKMQEKETEEIIAKAKSEGKITPADEAELREYAAQDLKGFKLLVSKLKQVIPTGDLPESRKKVESEGDINQTEKEIAAKMGVSVDDIKKYGGLE